MALTTHRLVSRPWAKLLARCAASARRATLTARLPTNAAAMKSARWRRRLMACKTRCNTRCAPPMTAPSKWTPPRGVSDSARQVALDSHRQSQAAQHGRRNRPARRRIADIAYDTRKRTP